MNNINKYTSLELSKKIYELAKEKGFELLESECGWQNLRYSDGMPAEWKLVNEKNAIENRRFKEYVEDECPALDIAEWGDVLGKTFVKIETYTENGKVIINSFGFPQFEAETEAEAMGQMYYYLLDNNLL